MSDLHQLLTLENRPLSRENLYTPVLFFLQNGIPATYTLEDAVQERFNISLLALCDDSHTGNTTPLHILCRSAMYVSQGYSSDDKDQTCWLKDGLLDLDICDENKTCRGKPFSMNEKEEGKKKEKNKTGEPFTENEMVVLKDVVDLFFEYGAGWNFLDFENKTVGELIYGCSDLKDLYQRCVSAGVQAELLLRKFEEIEWVEDSNDIPMEELVEVEEEEEAEEEVVVEDPAAHQETYLQTDLEYTTDGSALVTATNRDGVMMDWETDIMELAANTLCEGFDSYNNEKNSDNNKDTFNILNIGFGMGIIDTFIQTQLKGKSNEAKNYKHYICEAHPDVLKKLKKDGWYDNKNIVILEGRWQDCLNTILDQGETFFDSIYYDTFSEHYSDMLDLYDLVVGLIKPTGIFSFFNGLGADNVFFYDVYKEVVKIDMNNYGFQCDFQSVDVEKIMHKYGQVWGSVKQSYFSCKNYYHPIIQFQ